MSIRKNTGLNNILVAGKSVSDEVDLTVKGVGAGWTGAEVTLKGRTALRLSGENFYVTGRPQPGMWVPNTGSTSKLLIYKAANPKKVFRLDYHALDNISGRPVWHYNTTKGFAKIKGLKATNHAATSGASAVGRILTIFRWGGRAMFVVGAGISAFDVYYAENKSREITRQVGGWTGAVVGGKYGAKGGAKIGVAIAAFAGQAGPQVATPEEIVTVPAGVIIGSIVGAIGGGIVGWIAGTKTTETTFDWIFQPLEKEEWIIY